MLRVDINLLFTIINLLVLFIAMKIFLFKPVQKIITELKAQYKDDVDAIDEIERRIIDIEYTERKETAGSSNGQTPLQIAKSLQGHLSEWY